MREKAALQIGQPSGRSTPNLTFVYTQGFASTPNNSLHLAKMSQLMLSRLIAFLCIMTQFVLQAGAQDNSVTTGTLLRWKFTKDQVLTADLQQSMNQSMQMNGNNINVDQSTNMKMTWKVLSVDEAGNATIENVLNRAVMTMQTPQTGKLTVDTDLESDPPGIGAQIGSMLRPLVKAACTQKMSTLGKISDVVIPEDVLIALRSSPLLPGGTEGMMTEMIEKASPVFPEHALQKGDTWTQESSTPNPLGSIKLTSTYTYQGPEKNQEGRELQKIDVKLDMQFITEGNIVTVKEQDTTGTIYFDNANGRTDTSTIDQDVIMEINQGPVKIVQRIEQLTQATFQAN